MGPGLGLRGRDPPVALERRVVVDLSVLVEHAAVAVVRVFVQAQVGDHHVVVAELLPKHPERPLRDPVRVPRLRTLRVLAFGDAEQHEREHAPARDLGRLLAQGLERVLGLSGHRGDRHGARTRPP
jgi:hypothetical protein